MRGETRFWSTGAPNLRKEEQVLSYSSSQSEGENKPPPLDKHPI